VLDEFKDGAFRLAIEHHIPIAPMTFHDNKKRFPYAFSSTSAGPGPLRATVHRILPTAHLQLEDKRTLKDQTRKIILKELQQKGT
jgi:1-acyl-sn-glycerol-3-phosphate acyltransferase